jgi:hypothetical protein
MSLTSTANAVASSEAVAGTCPDHLVHAIRAEVRRGLDWPQTADCVANAVRANLPGPADILPAAPVAISMHVYGADISRLGNSIRREYTLPLHP